MAMDTNTIIAFVSISAAIVTAIFLIISFMKQKQQLLVNNFIAITEYIGNDKTRTSRRVLYKAYGSKIIKKLVSKYPDIDDDEKLTKLNEAYKQIGAMYERVGFLVLQNKELKEKIIEHHGFTMGIMWKIFEQMNKVYKEKEKAKGYTDFARIGDKSYCEWKDKINPFLENKKIQNENRETIDVIANSEDNS